MPDTNGEVEVIDGLPVNYPFDLDHPPAKYTEPGALHDHHAAVFTHARAYRWDGLDGADFAVHPADAEWHINYLLNQLTPALREALAALDDLVPMNLAQDPDGLCWQAADLASVLNHVLLPAQLADEALTKALRAARRRTRPQQAERNDQWTEFEEHAAALTRDASNEGLAFGRRLAAMDELIAHAHLQRARVQREQEAERAHREQFMEEWEEQHGG